MSDVPSDAQARLLLEELKQRNRRLTRRGRLLATVRDGPRLILPCSCFALVLGGVFLLLHRVIPVSIDHVFLLLAVVCAWVLAIDIETRKLSKRLDALVGLLEQEGLLQDAPAHADLQKG